MLRTINVNDAKDFYEFLTTNHDKKKSKENLNSYKNLSQMERALIMQVKAQVLFAQLFPSKPSNRKTHPKILEMMKTISDKVDSNSTPKSKSNRLRSFFKGLANTLYLRTSSHKVNLAIQKHYQA